MSDNEAAGTPVVVETVSGTFSPTDNERRVSDATIADDVMPNDRHHTIASETVSNRYANLWFFYGQGDRKYGRSGHDCNYEHPNFFKHGERAVIRARNVNIFTPS